MVTSGKQEATGKSVLLYSGGMDSLMFDYLMKPDVLLYIPTGSEYEMIESSKIRLLGKYFVCVDVHVIFIYITQK